MTFILLNISCVAEARKSVIVQTTPSVVDSAV